MSEFNDYYQLQADKAAKRKRTNKIILKWFLGIVLILLSFPIFLEKNILSGFMMLFVGAFCLPVISNNIDLKSVFKYVIVVLVPFIALAIIPKKEISATEKARLDSISKILVLPDKSEGYIVAQNFVNQNLKSPKSSDFVGSYQSSFYSDSTYVYLGKVDAVNAFNAVIRSTYRVEMKYLGGDWANQNNWQLLNIIIE